MSAQTRIREIPYNYTSFSDREIIIRLLGESQWHILNELREQRRTGRSARMLFEVLGDIWVIQRNPFIQDDLFQNKQRRNLLIAALYHRLAQIKNRAEGNPLALQLNEAAHQLVDNFAHWLNRQARIRHIIFKKLAKATHKDNICFDGLSRVSHVTDATDWRVEYPTVIIYPDTEQELAAIVAACIKLKLTIIPRGGGTGYTGGAIPLHPDTAIINTEKLDKVSEIETITLENGKTTATIHVEAGVVTRRVADKAGEKRYIFAVDPTSLDASTIGGNIAMNAGGKKAVAWGTTLDNLLSWRMVTPDAHWLAVERLNHNLGKIHTIETAEFRVTRYQADGKTVVDKPMILHIPATEFRRPGLGKDVTNKFLGGLPGVQKEGCDGLITSATFILHPTPKYTRTICLEFFGTDLKKAVPAIVETKNYLDQLPDVILTGMEHLDERYIRAVKYNTKSTRQELPKMLLLIDIGSENEAEVSNAATEVVRMAQQRDAEGFVAITPEAQRLFWQERARTAAIAAHTNAFKINEDVVIPLEKLADYNDAIERINIIQSTENKIKIIDAVLDYLTNELPQLRQLIDYERSTENDQIVNAKIDMARSHLQMIRQQWVSLMEKLDVPMIEVETLLRSVGYTNTEIQVDTTIFLLLQCRELRISYRHAIANRLKEIFAGGHFAKIRQKLDDIHATIRASRLFVANHMHAGDGNVHTNIPVNSNDYKMLHTADKIVEQIITLVKQLGGVISGEHGIGITKIAYLNREFIEKFTSYKKQVDPNGVFNRDKLLTTDSLQNAYTPSFRLLEQEALILEESELGDLNQAVKNCLRCGKCKPVCNTHVPRANLLYSPRNKILATGLMIEAFLYEEQTRRGISLRHFAEMNDVADHCTVCHKCVTPCPVNIDFGDVTVKLRSILKNYHQRKTNLGAHAAMAFLNIAKPFFVHSMRKLMIEWGYSAQRLAHRLAKQVKLIQPQQRAMNTTGTMGITTQVIHLLKKPMPNQIPKHSLRQLLDVEDATIIPILRDVDKVSEESEAVFYFPGCGSERLFSQISLATIALLCHTGAEVVLTPGYLCCGYPQMASGNISQGKKISTANQVLFHRVANTLNYMDIKTVVTSCGTCIDQLLKYQFQQIFPGCRLVDIHEYLLEKGLKLTQPTENEYLYHDPCHTPIKNYAPLHVATQLMGKNVLLSERCCGEAGTFAIARPDIATQVRFRKQEELHQGINKLIGQPIDEQGKMKLLTACPACLQGLSRYREEVGMQVDYIVVELANQLLGAEWQNAFIDKVKQTGIERVLL